MPYYICMVLIGSPWRTNCHNTEHIENLYIENMVLPENRVIGFVLLPIRPAELGKTTNITFTTSNNLRAVARIALLLQGKQQNTTLRQDITPGEISRKCVQGEALFIVVSIAASLMSAWASKRRLSPRSVVSFCKSCSSCFSCVHVASLHFPEEPKIYGSKATISLVCVQI